MPWVRDLAFGEGMLPVGRILAYTLQMCPRGCLIGRGEHLFRWANPVSSYTVYRGCQFCRNDELMPQGELNPSCEEESLRRPWPKTAQIWSPLIIRSCPCGGGRGWG